MPSVIAFAGGGQGQWQVTRIEPYVGATLPGVDRVSVGITEQDVTPAHIAPDDAAWRLCGAISNLRYTTREEAKNLRSLQALLDRPAATCAALIPIRKSQSWWDLAQDERREIFEETSHHTSIGMRYLPAIARRLHHSRDLGEPFDFLTWFEFAPEHEANFDALLRDLRETREWTFVDREVDIRLRRDLQG